MRLYLALAAPRIHPAFERGGAGAAARHRAERLGHHARRLFGTRHKLGVTDEALENAELVVDLMQMAEPAADILVGNFADQRQQRGIHRIGGE